MKLVFKKTGECVRSYNRSTIGYEYVGEVETPEQMYDLVSRLEDNDFYPQEDGKVLSGSGNEVFDPRYEWSFEFGDYDYVAYDTADLDEYSDAHLIRAIQAELSR